MVRFADPTALSYIWMSVGLFIFGLLVEQVRRKSFIQKLGPKFDFLASSHSPRKRWWHILLQCGALGFFALALARPLLGTQLQEVKQTGIEMIIAVDVSNSMMAEDDKPSRLEHAKHEINHLLDQTSGDRLGLIAFAGSAILVSPMTTDHSAIKMFVNSLSTESVSTQGTNFKDVIQEAQRAFERGGVEGAGGAKPTRVLLIASDGEDNEPGGLAEAKKAAQEGLYIYTIGFGSPKGAPIPLKDDHGNLLGYKKDKQDQIVMTIPSDEGLSKMAEAGGGHHYHSSFDEGELRTLVSDLDQLQKTDFKTKLASDYDEKFQIPLLLGLILAFLDLTFGYRKAPSRQWKGRFES